MKLDELAMLTELVMAQTDHPELMEEDSTKATREMIESNSFS